MGSINVFSTILRRPAFGRLLGFFAVSLILCSPAWTEDLLLTSAKGSVQVQRNADPVWKAASPGWVLKLGDKIRTGPDGAAAGITQKGHKLLIRPNTLLEIAKIGPVEWEFKQDSGRLRLSIVKLTGTQSLRVRTPTAICSVRGTELETEVEEKKTTLDVFGGLVSFAGPDGRHEVYVGAGEESSADENGETKKPQQMSDEKKENDKNEQKDQKNKDDKDKTDKKDKDDRSKQELKDTLDREVKNDLNRDEHEIDSGRELQSEQYQQGKTIIDAFGQRVRVEEYITRPTPDSFKYVSLNTRDNRFDFSIFEVVANKALPDRLSDAGNLWGSVESNRPEFYAVKERWTVGNSADSVVRIDLDGESMPVTFQRSIFSENGVFQNVAQQQGYQTVFDHRYEFINGDSRATDRMWSDPGFRPMDNGTVDRTIVSGMTWHMRPVQVELLDTQKATVLLSFWQDVFVTRDETAGETGKAVFVSYQSDPNNSFLSHFTEKLSYVNFEDTNNNGRLDMGESFIDSNGNGRRDPNEPFYDVARLGLHGSNDSGRGSYNSGGDTVIFSDLNHNNRFDPGIEPQGQDAAVQQPWAVMTAQNFVVKDQGGILDFRDIGLGRIADNPDNPQLVGSLYLNSNYERVWKSSLFADDNASIDVMLKPQLFLGAGLIDPRGGGTRFVVDPPNSSHGPPFVN